MKNVIIELGSLIFVISSIFILHEFLQYYFNENMYIMLFVIIGMYYLEMIDALANLIKKLYNGLLNDI